MPAKSDVDVRVLPCRRHVLPTTHLTPRMLSERDDVRKPVVSKANLQAFPVGFMAVAPRHRGPVALIEAPPLDPVPDHAAVDHVDGPVDACCVGAFPRVVQQPWSEPRKKV